MVPVASCGDLQLLVKQLHTSLGHAGRDKVLKMVRTQFYRPKLSSMAIQVVRECTLCRQYKERISNKFQLEKIIAAYPFQIYAMDLMDLPKTKSGFVSVMIGINLFSRYGHAIAINKFW